MPPHHDYRREAYRDRNHVQCTVDGMVVRAVVVRVQPHKPTPAGQMLVPTLYISPVRLVKRSTPKKHYYLLGFPGGGARQESDGSGGPAF